MAEDRVERRLTTILAADVVGYSRLMAADEVGTLTSLKALRRELVEPTTADYHGRVVKLTGDGTLMEFASVVDAVTFAVEVQRAMAERNAGVPEDRRIAYRVGINIGDIIVEGDDIYGDGVNVAARLEQLADPGGICIARNVFNQVKNKLDISFRDMGEQELKNIPDTVRTYRIVLADEQVGPAAVDTDEPLPLPDKPSIAVFPFTNMSGDPEQEYFSDGISEDIITGLSRYRAFLVLARNTTFTYKGRAFDVKQVARELGVRYVLEGSVRKGGNRVRVTAQLIDADTGNHLWGERYDRDLEDIFTVQDEITANVIGAIEPQIYAAESQRAQRKAPSSLNAWDCVTRALLKIDKATKDDFAEASNLLDQAIALDPSYAHAHSVKAFVSIWKAAAGWGGRFKEELNVALTSAETALALDPQDAWARYGAGFVHILARRSDSALAEMRAAVEINPSFALGHNGLGTAYAFAGQSEDALRSLGTARRLNPRGTFYFTIPCFEAVAHFLAGRNEDAVRCAQGCIRERRDLNIPLFYLTAALGQLERESEARAAAMNLLRMLPHLTLARHERATPIVRPSDRTRYIDGLRKAGVPE